MTGGSYGLGEKKKNYKLLTRNFTNSTVQYLYSTEIYPTRIRNVCYAFNMACHWFFQFAVVRVTPNMFASLDIWGAYVFWALECAVGLVLLWLWAPETKGVPMERMEELFAGKWYMGWKAKVDLSQGAASHLISTTGGRFANGGDPSKAVLESNSTRGNSSEKTIHGNL